MDLSPRHFRRRNRFLFRCLFQFPCPCLDLSLCLRRIRCPYLVLTPYPRPCLELVPGLIQLREIFQHPTLSLHLRREQILYSDLPFWQVPNCRLLLPGVMWNPLFWRRVRSRIRRGSAREKWQNVPGPLLQELQWISVAPRAWG